jgi:hypothetical protein
MPCAGVGCTGSTTARNWAQPAALRWRTPGATCTNDQTCKGAHLRLRQGLILAPLRLRIRGVPPDSTTAATAIATSAAATISAAGASHLLPHAAHHLDHAPPLLQQLRRPSAAASAAAITTRWRRQQQGGQNGGHGPVAQGALSPRPAARGRARGGEPPPQRVAQLAVYGKEGPHVRGGGGGARACGQPVLRSRVRACEAERREGVSGRACDPAVTR